MLDGWRKARRVRDLVFEHVSQVGKAMCTFSRAVRSHLENEPDVDAEQLALDAHRAESAADDTRRRVEQELIRGALLAPSRRQILEVIEQIDDLAKPAERVLGFLFLQHVEIPSALIPDLIEILNEADTIFHEVECGLQSLFDGEQSEVYECMSRIDQSESRVDEIERRTMKDLFDMDLDLARKNQLSRVIEAMVEISDRGEDLADRITLVTAERAF
jgi:uncharacterized protein